jgi:hypothetical protein
MIPGRSVDQPTNFNFLSTFMNNSINASASTSNGHIPVEKFLTGDRIIKFRYLCEGHPDHPVETSGFIVQMWKGYDKEEMIETPFNSFVKTPKLEFISYEEIYRLRDAVSERYEKGEFLYHYSDNVFHWTENGINIESQVMWSTDPQFPHLLFVDVDSPDVLDLYRKEGTTEVKVSSSKISPVLLKEYAAAIGELCCEISSYLDGPIGPKSVQLARTIDTFPSYTIVEDSLLHRATEHTFFLKGPQWKSEQIHERLSQMFDVASCLLDADFIVDAGYKPNDGDDRKEFYMGNGYLIPQSEEKKELIRKMCNASYWNPFKA